MYIACVRRGVCARVGSCLLLSTASMVQWPCCNGKASKCVSFGMVAKSKDWQARGKEKKGRQEQDDPLDPPRGCTCCFAGKCSRPSSCNSNQEINGNERF